MRFLMDRVHRLPRVWSNRELEKFARLFHGNIVNVSGWKDIDKEGRYYRDYFVNAGSYVITNYKKEAKGLQGHQDEIYLDLSTKLSEELYQRFDVVFNHTTLEHIYDVKTAFKNLCDLSNDIVILVLPFLQQYHSSYGDYWRFSPLVVKALFEENGFELLYQRFNSHPRSSVYTFTIASRRPQNWKQHFPQSFGCIDPKGVGSEPYIGCHAVYFFGQKFGHLVRKIITLPNKLVPSRLFNPRN